MAARQGAEVKIDAMQSALAAEHAAIYVLGVCAAQTSFSAQRPLWRRLDQAVLVHQQQRDYLADEIRRAGADPVAAAPAYEVPARLDKPRQVLAEARRIEAACATNYSALVAASEGDLRRWAMAALAQAAVRQLWFKGEAQDFPGR